MLIAKLEGDFMAIRSVEYLQSLVRELAKLPDETEWVEFKCNNKQPQMIGEYISALAIQQHYANDQKHILFGVWMMQRTKL